MILAMTFGLIRDLRCVRAFGVATLRAFLVALLLVKSLSAMIQTPH